MTQPATDDEIIESIGPYNEDEGGQSLGPVRQMLQ